MCDKSLDLQAPQLLPVALPSDAKALAGVADAVADYNRALAAIKPTAPGSACMTSAGSQLQTAASDIQPDIHHQADLTPWLAASLAPIGAAVTIQAHWRGRAQRQHLGALAPMLLGRRAAVCIQRAWRMCKPFASLCMRSTTGVKISNLHLVLAQSAEHSTPSNNVTWTAVQLKMPTVTS